MKLRFCFITLSNLKLESVFINYMIKTNDLICSLIAYNITECNTMLCLEESIINTRGCFIS